MMWARFFLVAFLALSMSTSSHYCSAQQAGGGDDYGGDYYDQGAGQQGADDYAQDNLYHDYALRQQEKAVGGAAAGVDAAGGLLGGWGRLAGAGAVGWLLGGKFHTRRQKQKLDNKFKQEQKALYQQYYEDVYTLQLQNAELVQALEQMGVRLKKS